MEHDTHNVVSLSLGQTKLKRMFIYRIRTSHDAAPYSPCCASLLTCYCTGLLTVWSLWGNPGMARCRKKSALAFGYIQKPKARLASCSGISGFKWKHSRGATGQVASILRYFFFLFLFSPSFSIPFPLFLLPTYPPSPYSYFPPIIPFVFSQCQWKT